MPSRRDILKVTGGLVLATGGSWLASHAHAAVPNPPGLAPLPAGAVASGDLEAIAGKLPLIKRSWRPPNYETPLSYFSEEFTPNRAFFVRYHLAGIPPEIAADKWTLKIGGEAAATPFELNFDQLKRDFPAVEIAAVNQCSGNRRGLFEPHVAGVEWGVGAMGNARWKGARLKDILAKAGLKKEALEIALNGADGPIMPATPDFQKSIPVWKALDENTLVAYEMNGEPLPHWNGFPARIVVPGWTGTYWMKHIVSINAISKPFDNFWVKAAYRIPLGKFPLIDHFTSQMTDVNEPNHGNGRQFADHQHRCGSAGSRRPRVRSEGHRLGWGPRHRGRRGISRRRADRGEAQLWAPTTAASRFAASARRLSRPSVAR